MKKYCIIIISAFAFVGMYCSPEDLKAFEPVSHGEVADLFGTWTGVSVNQRDLGAEAKGFPYKNEDMTAALGFNKVRVTLNGTAASPSTFAIDYAGSLPFFKFNAGNWKVDNESKVGKVYLINAANTDTITMIMGSYQDLLNNRLSFTQTKTLLGSPVITYEYKFSK